jgi:hypothetical protein
MKTLTSKYDEHGVSPKLQVTFYNSQVVGKHTDENYAIIMSRIYVINNL